MRIVTHWGKIMLLLIGATGGLMAMMAERGAWKPDIVKIVPVFTVALIAGYVFYHLKRSDAGLRQAGVRRRQPSSGEVAKKRLQFMLPCDRLKLPPLLLQALKEELIAAISKHTLGDIREGTLAEIRNAIPGCLVVGSLTLDPSTFEAGVEGKRALLTPVQFQLLKHLMSHPGKVFSCNRLLEEVWGYPPGTGDPDLTRHHIRNLRLKIEPDPQKPSYILTVRNHGYTINLTKEARGAP